MDNNTDLPHWNFEAFRNFIGFAPIQQACTSLLVHDGISLENADIQLRHLNHLLLARTGHEWTPDRNPGGNVTWETEGSLFRNKKRIFTSFYLIDAEKYETESRLILTPFGRAIAEGLVSEVDFYKSIIQKFEFPHPAYEDNWNWWRQEERELRPLVFILSILKHLCIMSSQIETVSTREIAHFGGPSPSTHEAESVALRIKQSRDLGETFEHKFLDSHDRKINDMIAFLAMSPWAANKAKGLTLNPIRRNQENSTFSWLSLAALTKEIDELTGEKNGK